MNNSGISGVRVVGGPQEAIAAMDEKAASDFLAGNGNDLTRVIEQLEERLEEDEE